MNRPRVHGSRAIGALVLPLAAVLSASPARAEGQSSAGWVSLGVLGGATAFDAHLADYRWDVTPDVAWGVQALVGRGRFAAGARLWRSRTTQDLALAGIAPPAVRATSADVVVHAGIANVLGNTLLATGSAGRLHLGYAPDRVSFAPAGGGSAVTVALEPVNTGVAGLGLALRRSVGARWRATLEAEARTYAFDTAHRAGNAIVTERERFREWNARFEIATLLGRQ